MSLSGLDLSALQKANEKYLCEKSFYYYARKAFVHAFKEEMVDGMHVAGLSYHLQALYEGQMKLLIGNLPPGIGKSRFSCVLFSSWIWTKSPLWGQWFSSYGLELVSRDSQDCRNLIQSDWYQSHWGDKFSVEQKQDAKLLFKNTAGGWRMSTTIRSQRGFGTHPRIYICDDPLAPKQAASAIDRQLVIDDWTNRISTRGIVVDVRRAVIAQRLHEKDLCGHLLENEPDAVHFMMPMEFEPDRKCRTKIQYYDIDDMDEMGNPKLKDGWEDPRTEPGELLWPALMSADKVKSLKRQLSSAHAIAGQLQQRPTAPDGDMFEKPWFANRVPSRPLRGRAIRAWDKASSIDKKADYTAGVLGIDDGEFIYICDCKHVKLKRKERDDLILSTGMSDIDEHGSYHVALEQEGGSGGKDAAEAAADELHQNGIPTRVYKPLGKPKKHPDGSYDSGGWEVYIRLLSEGRIRFVEGKWLDDFMEEHLSAPFGAHDDRIDAAARVATELFKMRRRNVVTRDLLVFTDEDVAEAEKSAREMGKELCSRCGGLGCDACEFTGTGLPDSLFLGTPEFDDLGVRW